MARYYFHLTDGKQVLTNHKGADLPGDAAARENAMVLARDLNQGSALPRELGRLVRHDCQRAGRQNRRRAGCRALRLRCVPKKARSRE